MKPGAVLSIPPSRIRPFAEQPREYFDREELISLELSIKQRGQLQPGMVRKLTGDRDHDYELIDGQRRWLACAKLQDGLGTLAATAKIRKRLLRSGKVEERKKRPSDHAEILRNFLRSAQEKATHLVNVFNEDSTGEILASLQKTRRLPQIEKSLVTLVVKLHELRKHWRPASGHAESIAPEEIPAAEMTSDEYVYSHRMTCPKCHSTNVRFRKRVKADPAKDFWVCQTKGCLIRISHVVMRVDRQYQQREAM